MRSNSKLLSISLDLEKNPIIASDRETLTIRIEHCLEPTCYLDNFSEYLQRSSMVLPWTFMRQKNLSSIVVYFSLVWISEYGPLVLILMLFLFTFYLFEDPN